MSNNENPFSQEGIFYLNCNEFSYIISQQMIPRSVLNSGLKISRHFLSQKTQEIPYQTMFHMRCTASNSERPCYR